MKLFSVISLLILLGAAACKNVNKRQSHSNNSLQKSIDSIRLKDLKDQPVDLSGYKGKTIFINFWATWCKPCREEMPSVQEAMKILKDKKIEFLFASDETTEQIEEFKAAHEYSFNYVKVESLSDLNIMGLPTTFIFSADGKLVFSEMGYRKWDDKTNIDLILNKSKSK